MIVFGKNGQVRFNSEEELRIAIDYGRINCKEFCDMVRAEARRR